jgi:hypothetical protein
MNVELGFIEPGTELIKRRYRIATGMMKLLGLLHVQVG